MSTRISGPYIAKQRKTPNPKQILHAILDQPGQKCLDFAATQGCRVTHTVETDEGTNPVDISLFGS